jgi:hypothetical protein
MTRKMIVPERFGIDSFEGNASGHVFAWEMHGPRQAQRDTVLVLVEKGI